MRLPGTVVIGCGVVLGLSSVAGCSGGQDPRSPSDEVDDVAPAPRRDGGPAIDSEIGALDENKVRDTFREARPKITKCLRQANDGLDMPVVGGELEVQLRVKGDGTLRWAYATRSTLGHRSAEQCVLAVLAEHTWPKPEGGDEGLARTDYGIDPPGRAPVTWSAGDLGAQESKVKSELRACMGDSGTSSLSVTIYVDPDGKVITAGGAAGDENGIDAIDCAVSAVKGLTFPSPGSYPAKVTVEVR